ncbi:MAG: T9SS type A sorting domain-containing protein [Fluviicola sp.]
MKKILLLSGIFSAFSSISQTTIYENNFNTGAATGWALNVGGSGGNTWIVNNEYTGFSPFIPDTPNQPLAITGGPQSFYLHIYNSTVCTGLGVCNAAFDTGTPSNQSAETPVINTSAYSSVTASFYYLCAGQSGTSYGVIEYSTNGGTTWTQSGAQISGVSTWTAGSISDAALSGAANLKIRFRWVNGAAGVDPAFAIDEFIVQGTPGASVNLTTGALAQLSYCSGVTSNITVNFNATGSPQAGNVYTAELSNASGSFASPTVIGTLNSTATGALSLSATIPGSTPVGTGYRIRVNASNPASTGTDNGSNISINLSPTVAITASPANGIICAGSSINLSASGANTYVWTPNTALNSSTTANVTANPTISLQYTVVGTETNGCTNAQSFTVTVNDCAGIEENENAFAVYPNPVIDVLSVTSENNTPIQSLEITDLTGKIIKTSATNTIDFSELNSGSYFIRIYHENGITVKEIVK